MKRIPRLLLVALALSLLVHLVVALILRPTSPTPQNQAEVLSIEHRPATIAVAKRTTPPPPPPPKSTPAPSPVASAPPRARMGVSGPASTGTAPTAAPETPAPASPTPSPAASANARCVAPNAGAAVAASPEPPDIAPGARTAGTSGVALVRVQLDPTGQVTSAGVLQSTGNASLDLVAVAMARGARYTPALHACKPIAAAYTFSVRFFAW